MYKMIQLSHTDRKRTEQVLDVFEHRVLRNIFGPVRENNVRRIEFSHELEQLYKGSIIVGYISVQRLR